ncbi:PadR family transcriptional regulator [Flavihumibacter sp. CACIAM 22H1]|uniref:PadR family transcriptional regulator n=1 Tax=Flavihumibacter sp. CACIAM 22H1 TaxID=1812911 RepID=UPI0007A83504|nr:PadR family transcriptional regulator [Flavihumibacter sp. CACIAM 22H1]KYP13076.1 MAG: PadR family transcriptional regulator [Flavihumibacter sp. CACIAM 22H1]
MKKSTLYKGFLEPIVMKLLKEQGRMYGYQITQQVKALTKGELQITEGALYPLLHRLEEAGLLETEQEEVGNRLRKYYKLTQKGAKGTVLAMEELEQFMRSLQWMFQPKIS